MLLRLSRLSEGNLAPLVQERGDPDRGRQERVGRGYKGGAGEVLLDAIRVSSPWFVALG